MPGSARAVRIPRRSTPTTLASARRSTGAGSTVTSDGRISPHSPPSGHRTVALSAAPVGQSSASRTVSEAPYMIAGHAVAGEPQPVSRAARTGTSTDGDTWRSASGMAVIEILQASRSDPELAALVVPTQERVEQMSVENIMRRFPGDENQMRITVRLFVWAIRGLALSRVLSRDPSETEQAVRLFRHMVAQSVRSGRVSHPDG